MTARAGSFVDANLLVLLVVGSEGRELIAKHRRLEGYSTDDYDTLLGLLGQGRQMFVTPNTLTETSNLLGQHGEPERSRLFRRFRSFIQDSREVVASSATASSNRHFERLGLSDAALLEVVSPATPLITVDSDLYLAALSLAFDAAINLTHHRTN